jgi:hypothetical protein
MEKPLTVLLLLFNCIIAFAQTVPQRKLLPESQPIKPLLQIRLDTLNRMGGTAKKAPVVKSPADTVYRYLPDAKEGTPLMVINSVIVGNLSGIDPKDIVQIEVKKDRDIPQNLFNLSRFGAIFVTLKNTVKIETQSFSDIKKWFGFGGKVRFALDGYFVDDELLRVAKQNIIEINVIREKYDDPLSDVTINIWTIIPKGRKIYIAPKLAPDKPSVIYIRGLASK